MPTMWHRFAERGDASQMTAIIQALVRAGVKTQILDSDDVSGPGILFFHQVSPTLCDQLRQLSRNGRERVLAVAISHTSLVGESAWRLLHSGASDVFAWDHSDNPASEIAARFERWTAVDDILRSDVVRDNLVGGNPAWISVLRQTIEVANFTDASILVCGESGTGKELVARLIHTLASGINTT